MIITKEVEIIVNNNKISYYREHGYPDIKRYDKITIPVEELGPTSKIKVECECDYCHEHFMKTYGDVIQGRKTIEKDSCNKCKYKKIEEVNLKKYGVKTNLVLEENKEKTKKTVREKYGVDNVMQNPEILERQHQSLFEHYGVTTPIHNPEIKEKIIKTTIKNSQGTIRTHNGMLLINGVFCSQAQKDLCNFLKFEINCLIGPYCVDGLKDNIVLEYNGGGHDIAVQQGKISKEDFDKKERYRWEELISKGYNVIVVENINDEKMSMEDYEAIKKLVSRDDSGTICFYQVKGSTTSREA